MGCHAKILGRPKPLSKVTFIWWTKL